MEPEVRPFAPGISQSLTARSFGLCPLALALVFFAEPAAAQDGALDLAAPTVPEGAADLATPREPETGEPEPLEGAVDAASAGLAVELGLRVGHGVPMEWDHDLGGQLATWLGATLSFGGARFSGTLAYDAAIGTAAHDAFAHAVALRLGYDIDGGPRHTRITISLGPYLRFGRTGTTECLVRCTAAALAVRAESQGILPMATGASLALDAVQPLVAWLVGVSVEARGAAPVEGAAVGALEIFLSFRLALDFAKL